MDDISSIEKKLETLDASAAEVAKRIEKYLSSVESRAKENVDVVDQARAAVELAHKVDGAQWIDSWMAVLNILASLSAISIYREAFALDRLAPVVAALVAGLALMIGRKLRTLDPFARPFRVLFASIPAAFLIISNDSTGFYTAVAILFWAFLNVSVMELREVHYAAVRVFKADSRVRYEGFMWKENFMRTLEDARTEGNSATAGLTTIQGQLRELVQSIKMIEQQAPLRAMQMKAALAQNLRLEQQLNASKTASCPAWSVASVRFTSVNRAGYSGDSLV